MNGFGFKDEIRKSRLQVVLTRSGGVEHYAISFGDKKPFVSPMKECHSIVLQSDDVVVDVGAYVGTYSKWCAESGVRKIVAYEPTPFTCAVLRRNLKDFDSCRVVEAAVVGDSYKGDSVELKISDGIGVTNGLVGSKRGQSTVSVPAVRFSEAVSRATVVKIDVEGAEYDYDFASLPSSVRAVIVDFHPVGIDWKDKAQAVVDLLRGSDFVDVITPNWNNGWTRAGSWKRKGKAR